MPWPVGIWQGERPARTTTTSSSGAAATTNSSATPATLRGKQGNDTIRGGAGDDTIFPGLGNDVVFGDAGFDSVVYNRAIQAYQINFLGSGMVTVTDNVGNGGIDFLNSVEVITFANDVIEI